MTIHGATENVAYYDSLAGAYDLFFRDFLRNMEEEGRWLDGVLRSHGARRVLDASCGTGRQALPLARRGYSIVAADPSTEMLNEAQRLSASQHTQLVLVRSTFDDLPERVPDMFDAVIALGNGLCNLPSRKTIVASLRGMRQCCIPGGVCLVGIKDFDSIVRDARQFHLHRIEEIRGAQRILFEVWRVEQPILSSTAFLFSRESRSKPWSIRTASTREYMLGAVEMAEAALEAGFRHLESIRHPAEKVYALYP